MMMNALRNSVVMAALLLVIRVYLGWNWLTSGWGKVTSEFDASGFIQGAIANPVTNQAGDAAFPWYVAFLEAVALPLGNIFSFMVAYGEVFVGLGLIFGILTVYASFFGLSMNFAFLFAGTVSTNPLMLLLGFFVLAAGHNAGRFGGDYYLQPYVQQKMKPKRKQKRTANAAA
ncbi:thiosulfate dehydrogenase [quinone] large subunit [Salibacterium salarium]|uniref:DoxX family protein n=1 Tax=Salibacterium salarium TaxID=284579 RepID=UPI002783D224|nr:DoxX family protein [Salibacterium salarium]MDQ0298472.1 thiosulfate dehydrogenase [quinone] large subunit [Salibacterium salarium]